MFNPASNHRRRKARRAGRLAEPIKPAVVERSELLPSLTPAAAAHPPAQIPDLSDLTRKEIMSQLDELGTVYSNRSSRAALAAQLWTALMVEG